VYSPKGGVGTTTIATNIAVAAAVRRRDKVVLVDLALQFGGVATHLNLSPKLTIADVIRDDAALREPELLRTYTTQHASGLHVLAAPATPQAADLVTADHITLILGTLLEAYESVVIDAGSTLDERVMTAFERAETILVPVYPEMSALKAVSSLLDYLNEAGSMGLKSSFVLNNAFAGEILKVRDVEAALGSRISMDLPYDPFIYLKAVNEGVPVVVGAPQSPAAERLTRLSLVAFGQDGYTVPAQVERKAGRFSFRRRA